MRGTAGNGGAPKTQGMKFSFDVPLPAKKIKVWGGCIEMDPAMMIGTGMECVGKHI